MTMENCISGLCHHKPPGHHNKGDTALHTAARNNNLQMVIWILNNNPNVPEMVNIQNLTGDTPLLLALRNTTFCLDVVQILLKCGADVNVVNTKEESALDLCYEALQYQLPNSHLLDELLLDFGANPNAGEPDCPVVDYLYNAYNDERMNVGKFQQVVQVLCNNWKAGFELRNIPEDLLHWLGRYVFEMNYLSIYFCCSNSNRLECRRNTETFQQHQRLINLFRLSNQIWCRKLSEGRFQVKLCSTFIPMKKQETDCVVKQGILSELVADTDSPSSLQDCCAAVIRSCLRPNALVGARLLDLPFQLKQCIVPDI